MPPSWYNTEVIEEDCGVILEGVLAEIPVPAGVDITPSVVVYADGEALVVLIAHAQGDGGRPAVLVWRWVGWR